MLISVGVTEIALLVRQLRSSSWPELAAATMLLLWILGGLLLLYRGDTGKWPWQ